MSGKQPHNFINFIFFYTKPKSKLRGPGPELIYIVFNLIFILIIVNS